jgi:hypothetical protein
MRPRYRVNQLMVEADLHLAGYFAEYLDTQNRSVPSEAWLGVLAHSSSEIHWRWMMISVPDGQPGGRCGDRPSLSWPARFLRAPRQRHGLEELRRSVLLPLELAWLRIAQRSAHPHQLARTVLTALDQHQSSRQR